MTNQQNNKIPILEEIQNVYDVDFSKLKRNYFYNPLKKGKGSPRPVPPELPSQQDLHYLYIEKNVPRHLLLKFFNCGVTTFKRWCKKLNIKKPLNLLEFNSKKSLVFKYGTSNICLIEGVSAKRKNTCLKKYGVENPAQNEEVKKKTENTNMRVYGYKWCCLNEKVKAKIKATNLKNHNNKWNSTTKEHLEHMRLLHNIIRKKTYETQKKNGTFGKSLVEEKIYKLLKQKYKQSVHHYKSQDYPFICDFYIPELNLYIEYQGFWTHGGEPFIGTKKQLEKVTYWKNKNNSFYTKAIQDWTVRDPLKRKTAKDNNLNWLEFFTLEDFMKWYTKQEDIKNE